MNNESCASENATATTTNASDAPDTMSEGARILIEAMKTNPEEFMPEGKYNWVLNALTAPRSSYALPMLSTRDHDLILAAVERYIVEPQFTERVIKATLGVEDADERPGMTFTQAMTLNSSGSLGIGTAISSVSPSHLAFHTQGGTNRMTITAGGQIEIETPNGKRVL